MHFTNLIKEEKNMIENSLIKNFRENFKYAEDVKDKVPHLIIHFFSWKMVIYKSGRRRTEEENITRTMSWYKSLDGQILQGI